MSMLYTHQELNADHSAGLDGSYVPQKEVKFNHNGREALYVVVKIQGGSVCCGFFNGKYAMVPGYIVNWQNMKDEDGQPISEVEPISDDKAKEYIKQIIETSESVPPPAITFWQTLNFK